MTNRFVHSRTKHVLGSLSVTILAVFAQQVNMAKADGSSLLPTGSPQAVPQAGQTGSITGTLQQVVANEHGQIIALRVRASHIVMSSQGEKPVGPPPRPMQGKVGPNPAQGSVEVGPNPKAPPRVSVGPNPKPQTAIAVGPPPRPRDNAKLAVGPPPRPRDDAATLDPGKRPPVGPNPFILVLLPQHLVPTVAMDMDGITAAKWRKGAQVNVTGLWEDSSLVSDGASEIALAVNTLRLGNNTVTSGKMPNIYKTASCTATGCFEPSESMMGLSRTTLIHAASK